MENKALTLKSIAGYAMVVAGCFAVVAFLAEREFFSRSDGLLLAQRLETIANTVVKVSAATDTLVRDQQKTTLILETTFAKLDSIVTIIDRIRDEEKSRSGLYKDILDAQIELSKIVTELRKKE